MNNRKHVECLKKVRKEILDANPEMKEVRFLLSGTNGITGQEIEYTEEYTKKNGEKNLRNGKDFVTHDFCPYCGEKYI